MEAISPDRARQLARDHGLRDFAESVVYTDSRSFVARVLEEIAESVGDPADPLSEFAGRWAGKLRRLEEQVDETLQEEYGLAVQLARGYIKGLKEAQDIPSQDLKNKSPPLIGDESDEFVDWANQTSQTSDYEIDDDSLRDIQELLGSEFPVGQDGLDIINRLADHIDDDDLDDAFYELSQEDPDADARPLLISWLQNNAPEALAKLDVKMDEAVGGDPVEDFLDSVEDPDILKYGDDTADEPVELYRRMNGLI